MSYDHSMNLTARMAEGVTRPQIRKVFAPIIDYVESYELNFGANGEFSFYSSGDVGDVFCDLLEGLADSLGPLVDEPSEIELSNHDTADLGNAITRIVFGPTKEAKAIFAAKRDAGAAIQLLKPHIPMESLTRIRQILMDSIPDFGK